VAVLKTSIPNHVKSIGLEEKRGGKIELVFHHFSLSEKYYFTKLLVPRKTSLSLRTLSSFTMIQITVSMKNLLLGCCSK
jgi:hypothetical protein